MPILLIVDLLAEKKAFGEKGTEEIIRHFPNYDILLWAPHVDVPRAYSFGMRVNSPTDCDVILITGSRRNVSNWEPWMDDVAQVIQTCQVPLYGICFGHQIICKVLGGRVVRAEEKTNCISQVFYADGQTVNQLFTHQDHVVDAGQMNVIATANHCDVVACKHPTRPIVTVQYHPEAVPDLLDYALACGDLTKEERAAFGTGVQSLNVAESLFLPR